MITALFVALVVLLLLGVPVFAAELEKGIFATDDCALAENEGVRVKITECMKNNLKITTSDDILYAEAVLKWE